MQISFVGVNFSYSKGSPSLHTRRLSKLISRLRLNDHHALALVWYHGYAQYSLCVRSKSALSSSWRKFGCSIVYNCCKVPSRGLSRQWLPWPEVIHHSTSPLHTLVWSLHFLHHLWPVALIGVNCVEIFTSLCNLYSGLSE